MDYITDFLPKYPNVKDQTKELFNPYPNVPFNAAIYNKKEFNRLERIEELPKEAGIHMKHQENISNFLSSNTMYDVLVVDHEMGTGKTCTAVHSIEKIRNEKNSNFKGAMIFANGQGLLNNFKNELIFKCTDGQYIPEDYEDLTNKQKDNQNRLNSKIKHFYRFNTFETFAKNTIKKLSDEDLIKIYSNRIIVMDEIHNIQLKADAKSGLNVYKEFHRFFHLIKNFKIILLSGTPMKDGPEEIASVMNLVLPVNEQLPTKGNFLEEFFTIEDELIKIRPEKKQELKSKFRGKISFLKAMESDVKKEFIGEKLRHFIVNKNYMSKFQSDSYKSFLESEKDKKLYPKPSQASLFVFPDGSIGEEGFNKYAEKRERKVGLGVKKRKVTTYSLRKNLKDLLMKGVDVASRKLEQYNTMLDNLQKYSTKYTTIIRDLLKDENKKKKGFIYIYDVTGSGAILFSLLLGEFGFSRSTGRDRKEGLRYSILTGKTTTEKEKVNILKSFNKKENKFGDYIKVIIGSKVLAEGYTLKNIQNIYVTTPWWNYSTIAQVIARGYRLGSHEDLLEKGIEPIVKIYQLASVPENGVMSIDLHRYNISEIKDVNIKYIERLIKEAAFDCQLNYERNRRTGYDGQRECEYMNCDYVCDETLDFSELDYSTYQLYHLNSTVEKIKNTIQTVFLKTFSMDIKSIYLLFPNNLEIEVLSALRNMINKNVLIKNKYGFDCYLRESNNIFFLADDITETDTGYYTEKPIIKEKINIDKEINFKIIDSISILKDRESIINELSKLDLEIQEQFLEISITLNTLGKSNLIVNVIIEHYKNRYIEIENKIVSSLLMKTEIDNDLRCMNKDTGVWEDCDEEYFERYREQKKEKKRNLAVNKYGYYGLINSTLTNEATGKSEFCMLDASKVYIENASKRPSGKRCVNWNKMALVDMIVNIFMIPSPDNFLEGKNRKTLLVMFNGIKKLTKLVNDKGIDINSLTDDKLKMYIYWNKKPVYECCNHIEELFREKELLIEDTNCGISEKNKK